MERINKRWILFLLAIIPIMAMFLWFILMIIGIAEATDFRVNPFSFGGTDVLDASFFFFFIWVSGLSILIYYVFGIRHPGNKIFLSLFVILLAVQLSVIILNIAFLAEIGTLRNGGDSSLYPSIRGIGITAVVFWFSLEMIAILIPFIYTLYYYHVAKVVGNESKLNSISSEYKNSIVSSVADNKKTPLKKDSSKPKTLEKEKHN